jgi:hypothetical protein
MRVICPGSITHHRLSLQSVHKPSGNFVYSSLGLITNLRPSCHHKQGVSPRDYPVHSRRRRVHSANLRHPKGGRIVRCFSVIKVK